MTPREQQTMRDLRSRLAELKRENRYLRLHRDKARYERDSARDDARYLHGVMLAAGIPIPERTRKRAA